MGVFIINLKIPRLLYKAIGNIIFLNKKLASGENLTDFWSTYIKICKHNNTK